MASLLGELFTANTFSKYITKEIALYLDPIDIRKFSCVNRFCNEFCKKEEGVQIMMAHKTLKLGLSRTYPIFDFPLSEDMAYTFSYFTKHLTTVGKKYFCVHLKDSCTIVDRGNFQIHANLNAKQFFGYYRTTFDFDFPRKDLAGNAYENQVQFLEDSILIAFFKLEVFKSIKTCRESVWIEYNPESGQIIRQFQLPSPSLPRHYPLSFHYKDDTIDLLLSASANYSTTHIRWDLKNNQTKHSLLKYKSKYGTAGFYEDYCVSFEKGDKLSVYHWPSNTLKATATVPVKNLGALSMYKNYIIAIVDHKLQIWKFENGQIEFLGTGSNLNSKSVISYWIDAPMESSSVLEVSFYLFTLEEEVSYSGVLLCENFEINKKPEKKCLDLEKYVNKIFE